MTLLTVIRDMLIVIALSWVGISLEPRAERCANSAQVCEQQR